uniref:Uncharacterized protein n=1 Tax=Arundo donax TaxID=35708 RepID=A0A0A9GZ69_ARUDO
MSPSAHVSTKSSPSIMVSRPFGASSPNILASSLSSTRRHCTIAFT